jgi:hypothetical protein
VTSYDERARGATPFGLPAAGAVLEEDLPDVASAVPVVVPGRRGPGVHDAAESVESAARTAREARILEAILQAFIVVSL